MKKPIDSDDDDIPLAKQRAAAPKRVIKTVVTTGAYSSDSDQPIAKKLATEKHEIEKKAEETAKNLRAEEAQHKKPATSAKRKVKKDESGSDSDVPMKTKKVAKKTNGVKKQEKESSDDEPLLKKAAPKKGPVKKVAGKTNEKKPAAKAKGGKAKKEESPPEEEEGEEEDDYKWWEMEENDGSTKWKTLEHNGVVFPPAYEPLPSNVKLKYEGNPVVLPVQAEEVAGFFGAMLHNSPVNTGNPKFVSNFFKDFQSILKKHGGAKNAAGKVRCFTYIIC